MPDKNYIKSLAIQTLRIEADAINNIIQNIDDDFCHSVELISKCKGRVIVTGIGKSAIIGHKIVATFNSTGTAAFFMHAADAVHGDVGMIQEDDVVLVLSKSGETAELKALIPLLKSLNHKIIGMCSAKYSYLATNADILIYIPVNEEADPNNLAPTASTIAQMAMGDALAISVLSQKGFTAGQFAKLHPGGSLGKQMYLRVKDLCANNLRPCVYINDSVKKAIVEITSKRLGAVVVLNHEKKIQGIITDGDIRRMLEENEEISSILLKSIMSVKPRTIDEDELAINALDMMRKNSVTQLVVTKNGGYVNIIHIHDILREGII